MPPVTPLPFFPPFGTYVLPAAPFDAMIANSGSRFNWLKSHQCPCTMSTNLPGTPQPGCQTCLGRGVYWDPPVGPFFSLITFMHMAPSPDEPGVMADEKFGLMQHGEPVITIPFGINPSADPDLVATQNSIWQNASLFDAFVEIDALERFEAILTVGEPPWLPYSQGLQIAPQGAVTTWDSVAQQVAPVSGYVVSGAVVTIPASYASGTPYTVEFQANPVWVAWRKAGGLPHVRPFGAPLPVNLPRRFRLQQLDVWLRNKSATDL